MFLFWYICIYFLIPTFSHRLSVYVICNIIQTQIMYNNFHERYIVISQHKKCNVLVNDFVVWMHMFTSSI